MALGPRMENLSIDSFIKLSDEQILGLDIHTLLEDTSEDADVKFQYFSLLGSYKSDSKHVNDPKFHEDVRKLREDADPQAFLTGYKSVLSHYYKL